MEAKPVSAKDLCERLLKVRLQNVYKRDNHMAYYNFYQ